MAMVNKWCTSIGCKTVISVMCQIENTRTATSRYQESVQSIKIAPKVLMPRENSASCMHAVHALTIHVHSEQRSSTPYCSSLSIFSLRHC